MVVSTLTRRTRIKDHGTWSAALAAVNARINEVLGSEQGFLSIDYHWSIDVPGQFVQVTRWETEDACRSYIRGGGAATVATIEEAAVPTAPYPDGAWVRANYATLES
jgi:quinol monooxygenase YgiN